MKKFIHNVKTTFGDPEKTKDEEVEALGRRLKTAHSTLKDYRSSMDGLKKAASEMVSAIDRTAKTFTAMAAQDKSEKLEAFAKEISDMALRCRAEASALYTLALDKDEAGIKKLNGEVDEARRLEEARDKKMKSYDNARYLVKTKEEEYQKKGKPLDDSKNYKEEVEDSDKKKKEYEDANATFKEKATAALKDMNDVYLAAMRDFLAATTEMFQNFQKTVASVKEGEKYNKTEDAPKEEKKDEEKKDEEKKD